MIMVAEQTIHWNNWHTNNGNGYGYSRYNNGDNSCNRDKRPGIQSEKMKRLRPTEKSKRIQKEKQQELAVA